MVDYSRWDKLDASDDEDDRRPEPQVHKFGGPQRVTIGAPGSGGQVRVEPEPAQEAEDDGDDEPMEPADEDLEAAGPDEDLREDVLQLRGLAERALRGVAAAEAVRLLEKAMRFGGARCPGLEDVLQSARRQAASTNVGPGVAAAGAATRKGAEASNGGVVDDRYAWSQTPEVVEVNVFVPEGTRAKAVAVTVTEQRVCLSLSGRPVLEGEWEYKVEPEEDPDWEVRDFNGRRAIRLCVRKAQVPGGFSVVLWWKRLLKGDPAIDVDSIQGRKKAQSESFAKAWQEAHAMFRERAQKREPVVIDPSSGDIVDDAMTG